MIKCVFTRNMFTFTCSVVQYVLCMHCTWLLYILNENNFEIDVRPDSRQVSDKTSMNNQFSYVYKKTKWTLTEYYCSCRYFPLQSLPGREMILQRVPDNSTTNRTSWRGSRTSLIFLPTGHVKSGGLRSRNRQYGKLSTHAVNII